jgi:hypothetical protein
MLKNHISLHSVGSVLDTDKGIVYPMLADNTPDYDGGIMLLEVSREWIDGLSADDHLIAHNTAHAIYNRKWKRGNND